MKPIAVFIVVAALAVATVLILTASLLPAKDHEAETRYAQENLVSDQAGVALVQDPDLVNAWGISFSSGSPFWSRTGIGATGLTAIRYRPASVDRQATSACE